MHVIYLMEATHLIKTRYLVCYIYICCVVSACSTLHTEHVVFFSADKALINQENCSVDEKCPPIRSNESSDADSRMSSWLLFAVFAWSP